MIGLCCSGQRNGLGLGTSFFATRSSLGIMIYHIYKYIIYIYIHIYVIYLVWPRRETKQRRLKVQFGVSPLVLLNLGCRKGLNTDCSVEKLLDKAMGGR
jgi:hypothetical protein